MEPCEGVRAIYWAALGCKCAAGYNPHVLPAIPFLWFLFVVPPPCILLNNSFRHLNDIFWNLHTAQKCSISLFYVSKQQSWRRGRSLEKSRSPFFEVAYSSFILLLALCQVLNAEGKIQLLQQSLETCLEGDITRKTKNRENVSCSFLQ